jgi:hypothetical protein
MPKGRFYAKRKPLPRLESGKNRGVGVASRPTGSWNRGYPRSEDVLQAAFQDGQPDLNEPVGAAAAPTHRLFLDHAPPMTRLTIDSTATVETRSPSRRWWLQDGWSMPGSDVTKAS